MSKRQAALRRAYIGRGELDDFFGYVTDIETGKAIYDEGEWTDVETALAWARARADQVVLTYGGHRSTVFSAGVEYYRGPHETALATWPPNDATRHAIDAEIKAERENPPQPGPGQLGVVSPMIVRSDPPREK